MKNIINIHFERIFGIWLISTIGLILLEGPIKEYVENDSNPEIAKTLVQIFETIFITQPVIIVALIIAGISEILFLFLRRG